MKCAACLLLCSLLVQAASEPAEIVFARAARALSAGDYGAAEQGFLAVLKQQPNNVGAIGNLGILYARTNRIDKAIAEYQRALRLSPNNEPILLDLGIVYLKEDLHSRALPYFQRVVAIDPHNGQARQLLDVCRVYTGQVAAAIRDLTALSQENPRDEQIFFLLGLAYLKENNAKGARAMFQQMFRTARPEQTEFLLGKASYEAAVFGQAEESFLQVVRLDPQFPGIHVALGKVYISERRTERAIKQLKEALNKNSKDEEANYYLGSLLVQQGKYEQGIAYLENAKRLKPDSYGVYLYLGRGKLHLGEAAEAVALLRKAVQLNPNDPSAQYAFARALQSSGQEAEARRVFARVRDLNHRALSEAKIPGIR